MIQRFAPFLVISLALVARAHSQEPIRIEAQAVPAPEVIAFHPKSNALVLVRDGADQVRLLDFTDPTRPFVRLTIPAAAPHAAFMPDGRIVTGGRDGMVRVWTETGREAVAALRAGEGAIYGLAVSPSGRLIATQDDKRALRLLSLDGRLPPPPIAPPPPKTDDGDCDDAEFGSSTPIFAPDERIVVFVNRCGHVAAVTADGQPVPLDDRDASSVYTMAFSRDGRFLAVRFIHQPGAVTYIWPLEGGRFGEPRELPEPLTHREFTSIAPGPGPHAFLLAADSRILGLAAEGRPSGFNIELADAKRIAISTDGSRIAVSGGQRVTLWDRDGRPLTPSPFLEFVDDRGVVVAPAGALLLAANVEGFVRLWSADGRRLSEALPIRPAPDKGEDYYWNGVAAAVSADGGTFTVVTGDGHVSQWRRDGTRARPAFRLDVYADGRVRAMAAPGRDRVLALTSDERSLQFFGLDGRPRGRAFALHPVLINALALSADGATIATAFGYGDNRAVQFWTAEGMRIGEPVRFERALLVRSMQLAPDGRTLVVIDSHGYPSFALVRRDGGAPARHHRGAFLGFLADGGVARTEGDEIVLETATGAVRRRVDLDRDFKPKAIMPDGATLLVHDGVGTRLIALDAAARPQPRHSPWLNTGAAAATALPGGDLRIVFDDDRMSVVPLGQAARRMAFPAGSRQRVHFSPDGTRLVIDTVLEQRVLLLYGEDGAPLAPPLSGWAVAFAPDSSVVAIGHSPKDRPSELLRYDRNGAFIGRTDLGSGQIARVAFARDGGTIAVLMDRVVHFLDRDGTPLDLRIDTGAEWNSSLAAGPGGAWAVLTGGENPVLQVWSGTGVRLAGPIPFPGTHRVREARFTPDGRHVVTQEDGGTLRLWAYAAPGGLTLAATRADIPYYSGEFGFAGDRVWAASGHAFTWLDPRLDRIATVLLLADGHLAALGDGRHCGAGPVFETRRAFRGTAELSAAERDALVDCAAVRAALGGR